MKILKRLLLTATVLLLSTAAYAFSFNFDSLGFGGDKALSPSQVEQVKEIIHQYFIEHPMALMEAFRSLQKYEANEQQKKAKQMIVAHAKEIFNSKDSPVMGNPQGDVTIVEFMDYRCKHCKDMVEVIKKLIAQDPKIRVVIKQLPIFGGQSEYAARVALAAEKQGRFKRVHEGLLSAKVPLSNAQIDKIAKTAGINSKQLSKAVKEDKAIVQQIKDNMQLAQRLSIVGTPAFILGDRSGIRTIYIPGAISLEGMQKAVAQLRKPAKENSLEKKG